MGLQIISTDNSVDSQEVFQSIQEILPGGFVSDQTNNNFDAGITVQKGELVQYNEATRKAVIDKLAKVHTTTATNVIPVYKGHSLSVGDILSSGAIGGEAYTITSIVIGDGEYDTVTVGTSLGSLTAEDVLWLSSAEGATAGAFANTPNGVLRYDYTPGANESVSVVVRGTVYERRLPGIPGAGVPADKKTAVTDRILFSNSY